MPPTLVGPRRYYFHGMTPPQAEWNGYTYSTTVPPHIGDDASIMPGPPAPAPSQTSAAALIKAYTESTPMKYLHYAASAALAYHGYKRNNSVGWALVWGIFGGAAWPLMVPIAFAQGFGKRRGK